MDHRVLEEKLRDLHSASFGWALACCAYDRDEAEDVLQTVYLKIIEGRARFAGLSSFRTWLFSVIRITAKEARRRHLRLRLALERFGIHRAVFSGYSFVSGRSEATDIRTALKSLSPRQREALELVFYHGLSIEEAAEVMRVSAGTARTHYERGKQALRKKLGIDKR
jgi:RNA polymerase sigma factor (sigma-70 family)